MRQYRLWVVAALLIVLVALLWFFKNLVVYIIVAVVLSLIGRPITRALKKVHIGKWHLSNGFCAAVALLTILGAITGFVVLFFPLLAEQLQTLSKLDVKQLVLTIEQPLKPIKKIAVQYHFLERGQTFWDYGQDALTAFLSEFEISKLLSAFVKFAGDLFIALFSITFITFFLLKEPSMLTNFILNLTPPGYEEKITNIMVHAKKLLSRYFLGLIIEETIVGTLLFIGLQAIGLPNALLIGFVGGLINIIPYVGPVIGLMFALLMVLTGSISPDFYNVTAPLLLKTFLWYQFVHFLDNMFMQPMIYSSSVKAHPLEIFIVIVAAGMAAGVPGLLLAIPVYTLIRVIARELLGQFKVIQSITENMYE